MSDHSPSLPFLPPSVAREVDASRAQEAAGRMADQRRLSDAALKGGVDPDYAPNAEFFESMSHQAIYDGAQKMQPGVLNDRGNTWHSVQSSLDGMLFGYRMEIAALVNGSWEGDGANAAQGAVDAFIASGQEASEVMGSVVSRLHQASSAAEAVRAAVPVPEAVDPVAMLPMALLNPPSAAAVAEAQKRAEEARQEAIRAMNNIYKPTMIPVGNGVPSFSAPTDPTSGGAGAAGGGSAGGTGASGFGGFGGSGGASSSNVTSTGSGANSAGGQADSGASNTDAAGVDGASGTDAQGQGATAPAGSNGQGVSASGTGGSGKAGGQGASPWTAPAAVTGDSSLGVAGGSGVGGSGVGGSAGGAGGTGYVGIGGLGGAAARRRDDQKNDASNGLGLGAVGGGVGGALAGSDTLRSGPSVAAGASAAARAGMPGGVMPHGRNEKGEDDSEHKTPGYLINVDNGNELVGDMPPAAPPVLGVWDEA
ncbi:hypothetical protein [Antrihabitans cavernicola]|uniref:hypothetical protein n=1 Tax=Antrihabitans cavernicola TaxID=2495913 RepID=UPI00165A123D|nr:hypothetical protein [Spelaeibacter cavernicola]